MFQELGAIYGARWKAQWTDDKAKSEAFQRWAETLSRFSTETIETALNALVNTDRFTAAPPTLPQFADLCRQYTRPERQTGKALPRSTMTTERALEHIANIKRLLAGKGAA